VQCSKVEIVARRNNKEFRATVSSRNTARFRLHAPDRLRTFSSAHELCRYWPLTVEALRDHNPPVRPEQAARPPVEFVKVSGIVIFITTLARLLRCAVQAARLRTDYSQYYAERRAVSLRKLRAVRINITRWRSTVTSTPSNIY